MFDRHWHHKPPLGTPINVENPLTNGLVAFWPMWEGSGCPVDVVSGNIAASNTAPWVGSPNGLVLSGATNQFVNLGGNTSWINVTGDITLVTLVNSATGVNGQALYGSGNQSTNFTINNYGGTQVLYGTGTETHFATWYQIGGDWHTVGVSQSGGGATFFVDGGVIGGAGYSSRPASYTGQRALMADAGGNSALRGPMSWFGIWNRALSQDEHLMLAEKPWQLFGPRRVSAAIPMTIVPGFSVSTPTVLYAGNTGTVLDLLGYRTSWSGGTTFAVTGASRTSQSVTDATHASVTVTTGSTPGTVTVSDGTHSAAISLVPQSFTVLPYAVPANHGGHITLTLTGTGTTWTIGTTWSLSGVSGTASLISHSVASATSATLVITTGSGTGTLTISDGTNSYPVTVAAATLAASPNPIAATGRLALAGTSTLWTQESPSGLFSAAGTTGAGLANITVVSDTLATADLAAATSSGTVTITDTSTRATATVQALGIASGSLHVTTPLLIGPPSGSTLFGGRSAATLAFRYEVKSNTVTDNQDVIAWGSIPGGGIPLAYYKPTTGLLTITAYGSTTGTYATHTFQVAVPIQLGIGYHILISWGTTPELYINGQLYATAGFSGVPTLPYQQVQIGGSGGPAAMDHEVSDLVIWNGYAATASDALALANRTSTPLRIGGTGLGSNCTVWWPLGGGSNGATPSLSDQWFVDYTSNGNTLSVASGSISGTTYAAPIGLDSPVKVAALISKSGKLAIFGTTSAAQAAGAGYPLAPITAVNGTPTISRNGTPIQIGPPVWYPQSQNVPVAAYLLQCGSVQALAIESGGLDYTAPTFSASGGGGSGLTFGTPVLQAGVTGYIIRNGGSGLASAPGVGIAAPDGTGGPKGNIGANAYSTISGGAIRSILPVCGGLFGCGQGYSPSSLPTVSIGGGSGAQLDVTVAGGVITAINVRYGLNGAYYPASVGINIWDPTGSGAAATVATGPLGGNSGYYVASVTMTSGGSGYTSPVVTLVPGGSTIAVEPVISTYIATVPITDGGSGYTSPPTITVSDATGSGAILKPIMSGASAGDTFTYSAPAGWITPTIGSRPLGGLQAATNAAMDNWTGQLEGVSGGFKAFAQTPSMMAGVNVGEQPANAGCTNFTAKNRMRQGPGWSKSSGSGMLSAPGGTPSTWTSPTDTILSKEFYSPSGQNGIDQAGFPDQIGDWTILYDDPNINSAAAMALWLGSDQFSSSQVSIVPLNGSGPNSGTTTGVTVDPSDITFTFGGGLTSIGVSHSSLGTGWQGAIAVISGGSGTGAVATAQVSGGAITGFTIVCPGTGFGSTPTVRVYGTKVSGTAVTIVYRVGYASSNPTSRSLGLTILTAAPAGGDGLGHWTIGNIWAVAPDAWTGGAVASIDRSFALATDDNMIRALTGTGGQVPAVFRFMDVAQGYGGVSNYIFASDLPDPSTESWGGQSTTTATFRYVRHFNTDPGSSTYSWSSQRVYGPQAYYGAGPDSFGHYIELPTTDAGFFLNHDFGSQSWVIGELRSETPHGLTTGQFAFFSTNSGGTFPVTNLGNWSLGGAGVIFVTGPYTVAWTQYAGGSAPASRFAQTIDSTTEVDLSATGGITLQMFVPQNSACVPIEYTAAVASQFPGSALWVNIPHASTDGLVRELAQRVAANIGTSNEVWLEYGNENWNSLFPHLLYYRSLSDLIGYTPQGTTILTYYTNPGGEMPYDVYGPASLITAYLQDVFQEAWVAAGKDPSKLRRVQGSWYGGAGRTQEICTLSQAWGFPVDYPAIAPYLDVPGDTPVTEALLPAGWNDPNAAYWPIDAYIDLTRHWIAYSALNQSYWSSHTSYLRNYGQPLEAPALSASGSGGSLNPGRYYACHTFVDSSGRETTIGLSRTGPINITAGQVITMAMPIWPLWATALNIYLTPTNDPPGTEVFYLSIPRSQYLTTYGIGSPISFSAAIPAPGTQRPPTINHAAPNVSKLPQLITYEGAIQTPVPGGVPFRFQYEHDVFAHPSARDLIWGWYAANQLGDQTVAGSGAIVSVYYQLYNNPYWTNTWFMSTGTAQPPGVGSTNLFATIQGGLPADGHDHNGTNVSPALQGFRDWFEVSSPLLVQPVSSVRKRRWFAGLGQNAMRLGR